MAVTYGFYNSLNGDRKYNAEDVSHIFNGIITDGVFSTIGDALMTVAGTGMQVVVKTGKCWFNGTWTMNDSLLPLDIEAADVSLTRIDAVVVEVDTSVATRANSIKIVKGTASANPAKPSMKSEEFVHQYPIAYVTISAGVTSITADKISVNVGRGSCPFITSVLQQTDIGDLFNQWEAEFEAWFENVQTQLSGDVAANLQRQITENKNKIDSFLPNASTRMILGLSEDATPNDAWQAQALGAGKRIVKVTVKWYLDQTPVQHMYITGGAVIPNHTLYTDENGECYISVDANSESIEVGLKNTESASGFINKKTISKTTSEILFYVHRITISARYSGNEAYGIFLYPPQNSFAKIPDKDKDSPGIGSVHGSSGTVTATLILVDDSIRTNDSVSVGGDYIDTPNKTIDISIVADGNATAVYNFESGYDYITYSTKSVRFSPKVKKYDIHLVGGGGGGMCVPNGNMIGNPGRAGGNNLLTGITATTDAFNIVIGSGGSAGTTGDSDGANGGITSVTHPTLNSGNALTCVGGSGGSSWSGGSITYSNGTSNNSTTHMLGISDAPFICCDGCSGGFVQWTSSGTSGLPSGTTRFHGGRSSTGGGSGGDAYYVDGENANNSYATNGSSASTYGSGGGSGGSLHFNNHIIATVTKVGTAGRGMPGCVAFRWYY